MTKAKKNYFNSATTKNSKVFHKYVGFFNSKGRNLKNQNVCDIGCATGNFISEIWRENNCFGVDNSDFAIKHCKKKYSEIKEHFALVDLNSDQKLPFKLKFDLITLFDVIEHIDNLANLKEIIAKSIHPGGYLLITTPNANNFLRFINRKWFTGEMDRTHVNLFTPYTLDFFLRKSGYKRVKLFTPYNFCFKDNWFTNNLLFGGQIFALYKLSKRS